MAKKLIALCACPMGLAHTFMAAQALEDAATEASYEVKIETQGADGIQNRLTRRILPTLTLSSTPSRSPRKTMNASKRATCMRLRFRTPLKTRQAP